MLPIKGRFLHAPSIFRGIHLAGIVAKGPEHNILKGGNEHYRPLRCMIF